jgi:hypothetical protein
VVSGQKERDLFKAQEIKSGSGERQTADLLRGQRGRQNQEEEEQHFFLSLPFWPLKRAVFSLSLS